MTDFTTLKNKIVNEALDQPLLAAIFICDFAILLFHRPPLLYSVVMMGLLVAIAMYFGQKMALFNVKTAFQFLKTFNFSKSTEKAVTEAVGDVEKAVSKGVREAKELAEDAEKAVSKAMGEAKEAAKDVEKAVSKAVDEAKEAVSDVKSAVASAVETKPAKPKAKPKAKT